MRQVFVGYEKRHDRNHASLLGYSDSNQEKQDQNLLCYHYTIAQNQRTTVIFNLTVQRYNIFGTYKHFRGKFQPLSEFLDFFSCREAPGRNKTNKKIQKKKINKLLSFVIYRKASIFA